MVNLAQLCARRERAEWPQIVRDHFRALERSDSEQEALQKRLADFGRVAELLSLRIWPEEYLADLDGSRLLFRRDLPGTVTSIVYDLPTSIRNVTPDEAAAWNRPHEELFRIALDNVRETCIPNVKTHDLGEGVRLLLLSDESFFVASHALLLDERPEAIGDFGTLVGIPNRHTLLAHPIADASVAQAVAKMIPIIVGMERDGPGSISSRLYWHQHGEFVDLPYRVEPDSLVFTPPEAFVEMVQLLGESDDADDDDSEDRPWRTSNDE